MKARKASCRHDVWLQRGLHTRKANQKKGGSEFKCKFQPLTALTILRMEISKCWLFWACVSTKMRRKEVHHCEYPADIQESSVRLLRKHMLLARMLSSAKAFLIRYVGRLCFSLSSEHVQKPLCLWGFCWMYSFCCVCVDQIFRKPATNRPFRWTGEIPRSKSTTLQVVAGITRIWWHFHYSSVCLIRSQILTWSLSNCPTKQPANRNTHILFAFSLSPFAVELRPTVLGVALPYVKRTPKACEHVGRPDICTWRTTEQKKVTQLWRLSPLFFPYLFWPSRFESNLF